MRYLHVRNLIFAALMLPACAPVAVASMGNPPAQDAQSAKAGHDDQSAQPGSDAWITTKVKADLLATKDVPGMDLRVDTRNGVVTLAGRVDTQAEADRAIAVARNIKGVTRVDSSGLVVGRSGSGY
jgi:hyperosmotically inducible protein